MQMQASVETTHEDRNADPPLMRMGLSRPQNQLSRLGLGMSQCEVDHMHSGGRYRLEDLSLRQTILVHLLRIGEEGLRRAILRSSPDRVLSRRPIFAT